MRSTTTTTKAAKTGTSSATRGWSLDLSKEESKTAMNCQVAMSIKADLDLLATHYDVPLATVVDKIMKHALGTNVELKALKALKPAPVAPLQPDATV